MLLVCTYLTIGIYSYLDSWLAIIQYEMYIFGKLVKLTDWLDAEGTYMYILLAKYVNATSLRKRKYCNLFLPPDAMQI